MWRVFAMAAALTMAMPTGAWASVGDDVRAQCATTAWDSATCGRLARIADALVASEDVSEQLAREVDALPVEQREWLGNVLTDLLNRALAASAEDDGEVADLEQASHSMGVPDAETPHRRPPNNVLAEALRKARDFIRSRLG